MKRQDLELYTRDPKHHGVNSEQVLRKFMEYQGMCRDPLLVFRYMEEKAICTFLPDFWLVKASIYALMGDYSSCFEAIELAKSRVEEEDAQMMTEIEKAHQLHMKKLIEEMKKYPLKTKRTVTQFNLTEQVGGSSSKQKQAQTLRLYQEKYGSLRREKQAAFTKQLNELPRSWLHEEYQKQDKKQQMIQEKVHQNSVRLSRQVKYHSMHTPIKARDPQRLTKTMDSVEILKKKKSTRNKSRKCIKHEIDQNGSEPDRMMLEDEMGDEDSSRMMVSLPVGNKFKHLHRRVTFKTDAAPRIEKIRFQKVVPSFGKNQSKGGEMETEEKMEEENLSNPEARQRERKHI